jgi:RNA polymerase sigma factor (sigma-70 family)
MSEPSFAELIERLKNNEREAVDVLIIRYGRALRRAIERTLFERRLINGPNNPTDSDASDIFQTVLLLFLARLERSRIGESTGAGISFETPGHLVAYLKAIAGNEIKSRRRRECVTVGIRNRNEITGALSQENAGVAGLAKIAVSSEPSPSQSLIARELMEGDQAALAEVHRRLRPDERAIWELVRQELSWPEIASRLNGSAEALRKTFTRAVRRIAGELGSWSPHHD